MKIDTADVTLKVLIEDGWNQEVRYGKRKRVTRKLRAYEVFAPDGRLLGIVSEGMATFEHRTRGRMYVNSRWSSPRWYWSLEGSFQSARYHRDTRKAAIEDLLYRVNLGDAND